MLRQLMLNRKKVPIPVPVRTLAELLTWVSDTLLAGDSVITKVVLDANDVDLESLVAGTNNPPLSSESKVEVRVDSPMELTIQTVDAVRNLASVIEPVLRTTAVECWEAKAKDVPSDVAEIISDLELLIDLLSQFDATIQAHSLDVEVLGDIGRQLREAMTGLRMATGNSDWRGCSKILLHRLEPTLAKLIDHSIAIQNQLFQLKATNRKSPPVNHPSEPRTRRSGLRLT